jgi:pimeloyl-ACP methyl ester carboxylesterase
MFWDGPREEPGKIRRSAAMPKMRTEDGVDIHYHVDDFRDPWRADPQDVIVMAHGFCRNMKWWTQWVPALSRKYRLVRYDVRGCGESSAPPEGATWTGDRVARDALDLIDHLGIQKVHWLGFESGGVWGELFAINHPDRIRSLTVLNSPVTGTGRRIATLRLGDVKASDRLAEVGLREYLTEGFAWQLKEFSLDPRMVEWHIDQQAKTPQHVAIGITIIFDTADLSASYSKIQVPTLIMIGDKAKNCPLEEQAALARTIPDARLVVLPNSAAAFWLIIPDRASEEVLRFLESL